MAYVRGHYRRDGSYVRPHYRRTRPAAPSSPPRGHLLAQRQHPPSVFDGSDYLCTRSLPQRLLCPAAPPPDRPARRRGVRQGEAAFC